ncbi:aminodeoxychorismate synthase component I [Photobacterium salinisoli]|uniref:aminodeoxychorismate synthase component I n=1 Tax=Photobacterium salinisoli TaxID=1616783 RepID=UPI000EA3156A|nr:aminodeoxychorismate synthase component I [Photobacterium salinisoli]
MNILIIDNYDSFTNNISQYVFELTGIMPTVVPNSVSYDSLNIDSFSGVILSPGPGHPCCDEDFGVCGEIIDKCCIPILGICLGHQGINARFGGKVSHAPSPVHGYKSQISHNGDGLFSGIPQSFNVVRYHSLICTEVPECLDVTARTADGLIMGLAHREKPIWGVQFHPESIESEYGHTLIGNFINMINRGERDGSDSGTDNEIQRVIKEAAGTFSLKVNYEPLKMTMNAADIFSRYFSGKTSAFWLDSEMADARSARYSLMGSGQPNEAIVFRYEVSSRTLHLSGPCGESYIQGDYFELMDRIVAFLKPDSETEALIPYGCGLVGYLGYELKALMGSNNKHRSSTPDALFFLPQNLVVFDHQAQTAYLCHLWGEPMTFSPQAGQQIRTEGASLFQPGPVPEQSLELEDSAEMYIDKIHRCLKEIRDGESYEICLTNRARLPFNEDALSAYMKMRLASPVPYGAYMKTPDFAILSASPETFLHIDSNRTVRSKPIKGTRPRGKTAAQDEALKHELACSEKDRAENLMIIDLVRHDLNSICTPGTVHVPKAFDIETYSSVHQLVSTIEGQLQPNLGTFSAIKACFPGGSMTGAPKRRTMDIIDDLESSARGIYAGSLGWVGMDGCANLSIVIRTAVIKEGVAEFGIGGAIVSASCPLEEMDETLVKASVPFYSLTASMETKH